MKKTLLLLAVMLTFIGMSAQNPYAYKLSSTDLGNTSVTLHYSLNAPAQAVALEILDGESVVATINVPETMIVAGDHEYIVNFADYPQLPTGKQLTWRVKVTGTVLNEPAEITDKVLKFYSPAGVAVDVNPESDDFGNMYITESTAKASATYFTNPDGDAVGIGLYKFDPQFNCQKNAEGKYGFSCGMQSAGTTPVDWRPSRIHISDDGRMFILSQRVSTAYPLYEINRETLQASPLFAGTLDTSTGIVANGDVQVAAGVGVAFDVIGSGDNLKLMMMTCTPGTTTIPANYKTNEYNIGTATSWGEAPSRAFTAFDGKAINYAGINLAYDYAGGIWMSQWRGAPTEGEPSYAYANLENDELQFLVTDIYSRNGGMAFNKDHTLMVRGEGYSKKLAVYAVEGGAITKLYEYSCPSFTGWNQFAFDYAGNLIACDNAAEVFGMIQLPYSGEVTTPCAEKFNFEIAGEPVETEFYLVGSFNDWKLTEEEGRLAFAATQDEGIYELTCTLAAGDEFKVITPVGDGWKWYGGIDEYGSGYFLINGDLLNVPIAMIDGANFRIESGGKFTMRVDAAAHQLTVVPVNVVPGDVDGDGIVTSADVTALYSFLLTGDTSSIVNGDQNGDGEITSGDITVVYNCLLGVQ